MAMFGLVFIRPSLALAVTGDSEIDTEAVVAEFEVPGRHFFSVSRMQPPKQRAMAALESSQMNSSMSSKPETQNHFPEVVLRAAKFFVGNTCSREPEEAHYPPQWRAVPGALRLACCVIPFLHNMWCGQSLQ